MKHELFSNIQNWNLKNQKPVAVDVLFKAYPVSNGTTFMQTQSGGKVYQEYDVLYCTVLTHKQ